MNCVYHDDSDLCEWCGCYWQISCKGTGWDCDTHGSQGTCELCGCDWIGMNMKINVGDVWRDVEEMKINVGDTWRTVIKIQINVGDTWRTVYSA